MTVLDRPFWFITGRALPSTARREFRTLSDALGAAVADAHLEAEQTGHDVSITVYEATIDRYLVGAYSRGVMAIVNLRPVETRVR